MGKIGYHLQLLGNLDDTIDSSILYDSGRIKLLDSGEFWLSLTPEKPSYFEESSGHWFRNCVWGRFGS